jgi:hypothetical protein
LKVGAPLVVGIIVVIVAIGSVGYYFVSQSPQNQTSSTTSTTTTTSSVGPPPPGAKAAYVQHLSTIDTRNIPVVLNDYVDNALVVWSGSTGGLGGSYSGIGNIRLLYSSALSSAQQISLTPSGITARNDSSTQVTTNMTLALKGQSQYLGAFNGTIRAGAVLTWVNGAWKVVSENWYWVTLNTSAKGGATTFPEWQKIGPINPSNRSPDWLHNFVWDYGGYWVAAIIYVYVLALATILLVRRRRSK